MTSPVTAESLNRATHELALRMLARPEVGLYEKRGKRLSFLPDRSKGPSAQGSLPQGASIKSSCTPLLSTRLQRGVCTSFLQMGSAWHAVS